MLAFYLFTTHTRSVMEGNVFSLSVHRGAGGGVNTMKDLGVAPLSHQTWDWTGGTPTTGTGTGQGGHPHSTPLDLALDRGYPPLDLALDGVHLPPPPRLDLALDRGAPTRPGTGRGHY